jgi:hypothetical protein
MGNRVSAAVEIEGLDIPEMGVQGYVHEDTAEVAIAGQEFLSTHGPGVPSNEKHFQHKEPRVPTGAR